MFSHALIMYQNTLVSFWDKTAKTMNHVNNGFKVEILVIKLYNSIVSVCNVEDIG